MENYNLENEKIEIKLKNKSWFRMGLFFLILIFIFFIALKIMGSSVKTKNTVRTSLDSIVEKSDLETVSFMYNVIAKKCKDDNNCNLSSNNIDDFKYVVSCKGTVSASIDFKDVKIDVDDKKKIITVSIPEAKLSSEPSVGSVKFLSDDISADELPNARILCAETIKSKSEIDEKLLPTAKKQAKVVLDGFYSKWIKAYDSKYIVEIK